MTTARDALMRCGGEARTADLLALTTYREIEAATAAGSIVKLHRGRYGLPNQLPATATAHAHDAVVSHLSAAEYWEFPVLSRPDVPHLTLPPHRKVRDGPPAHMHWSDVPAADRRRRVTAPTRTVLDCARTVSFAEGLAVADGAVRSGLVKPGSLRLRAARLRGPGSAAARRVAAAVDGRSESCLESALRAILLEAGITGFEPQMVVDEEGLRIRVDFGHRSQRLILEADSFEFHGHRAGLVGDCWRYDELVARGWRVLRFSYEHIIGKPEWVRHIILRALGNGVGTDC